MMKKYLKPQFRIKKHEIFDEIANELNPLSLLLEDLIPEGEEENEEWVG